jgi:3-hydroxyisobutyrate dehydrogenase-like beta-hydroxyacid dehydrogenase
VIGLRRIGGGIAERLCSTGWKTAVVDIVPEVAERWRGRALVAGSNAQIAGTCNVILVAVHDGGELEEVVSGPHGFTSAGADGTTCLLLSTIPRARSRHDAAIEKCHAGDRGAVGGGQQSQMMDATWGERLAFRMPRRLLAVEERPELPARIQT